MLMAIPPGYEMPQGDGTVCFMAHEKKEHMYAYITLHYSFILAQQPIVMTESMLSQLKPTKCMLKCLCSADKLSHKLHCETFKI